ncbi:MAG: hypothetical protein LUG13_07960 [Oscillospiraceae bacterium]|nr:hypothetical protein [Oscillospiraceae bacterium]
MVMQEDATLQQLRAYALSYRVDEYFRLANQLLSTTSGETLGRVYLSMAQVKLCITDDTLLDDCLHADALLPEGYREPPYFQQMEPQDANTVLLFQPNEGYFTRFLSVLEQAQVIFEKYLGEYGKFACLQAKHEILYFTGTINEVAVAAEDVMNTRFKELGDLTRAVYTSYLLVRIYIQLGRAAEARQVTLDMANWALDHPDAPCNYMYQRVRSWINLTTGWGGDAPRFYTTPDGSVYPMLDERNSAMQQGVAEYGPTEKPFIAMARQIFPEIVTMRWYYAEIYRAVVYFKYDDLESAQAAFRRLYPAAHGNKVNIPFVEYGAQIVPFLDYLLKSGEPYDPVWLTQLRDMALDYEEKLNELRQTEELDF